MQSGTQIKTHWTFLTLAGLILTGVLSACGGGSGEVDRIKSNDSAVITPSVNPLNKYIGTYRENKCWKSSATLVPHSGIIVQLVFSTLDKPNTLKFTDTHFYYQASESEQCGVQIGSSIAYGEMTYFGTLPSVEFLNSTKQPLEADKFQFEFTNVINEGVYGEHWDELSEYKNFKGLIALEGNTIYFHDKHPLLDAEDFPTQLGESGFLIRQKIALTF